MFIVRPIKADDIDAMHFFGDTTSRGISNLPAYLPRVEKYVHDGIVSFEKEVIDPWDEVYPFIIENSVSGEKVGTSSILAKAGVRTSFCSYYLENLTEGENSSIDGAEHALLYPKIYTDGPSELLALYLLPSFRKGGLGKLLSLSRLLYIANQPHRFNDSIFADMRGYFTPEGACPFWNGIGGRLWKCSFSEILNKIDKEEVEICGLIPRFPLHWRLLHEDVQKYAGKLHPNSQAAYYMLTQQGLAFCHEISILDGGPIIKSAMNKVKIIQNSKHGIVADIASEIDSPGIDVLICNKNQFRATCTRIEVIEENKVRLDQETIKALNLDIGSPILFSTI